MLVDTADSSQSRLHPRYYTYVFICAYNMQSILESNSQAVMAYVNDGCPRASAMEGLTSAERAKDLRLAFKRRHTSVRISGTCNDIQRKASGAIPP